MGRAKNWMLGQYTNLPTRAHTHSVWKRAHASRYTRKHMHASSHEYRHGKNHSRHNTAASARVCTACGNRQQYPSSIIWCSIMLTSAMSSTKDFTAGLSLDVGMPRGAAHDTIHGMGVTPCYYRSWIRDTEWEVHLVITDGRYTLLLHFVITDPGFETWFVPST